MMRRVEAVIMRGEVKINCIHTVASDRTTTAGKAV